MPVKTAKGKISVVINTFNEEDNLPRALASVKDLADEVVVVDMKSTDKTVEVAGKGGARVYEFKKVGYVEPARNYAISKAVNDWVLVLDADEEIPKSLAKRLKRIVEKPKADYYRIPRKNMIFGKWMKHTQWWPDYQVRFFKKGKVTWSELIHSVPITSGTGADFPAKGDLAIFHRNYDTVEQFLERMNRYTTIQANLLVKEKHKFLWKDLIKKPTKEFLDRYFSGEGYKDGLHGLALSLLQAFSVTVVYIKVWQKEKFLEQTTSFKEVALEFGQAERELNWWLTEKFIKENSFFKALPKRIARKVRGGKKA